MAFTVYQSGERIGAANAGQAASQVSRDFFLDQGKANAARGWAALGEGLGQLNDAQFAIGLRERQEQFNASLIAEVQAYQDRTDQWTNQYREEHRFEAAQNTAKDADAWHQNEMGAVMARWQGNPNAERYLSQHLTGIRNSSLSNGRAYQTEQLGLFKNQLFDRSKTEFLIMAEDLNVSDADLMQRLGQLSQQIDMLYAGGDGEAAKLRLAQEFREARQKAELDWLAIERAADPYRAHDLTNTRLQARTGLGSDAVFAMSFESSGDAAAIGYDSRGGTSYGAFQISSATMPGFLGWLEARGGKDATMAHVLRNAGEINTGSTEGNFPDVWRALVQEGHLTFEMQDQFIRDTHVKPALAGAPGALRQLAADSPTVSAAVYSTAVQHGSGAAAKLFERAWNLADGNQVQFIHELYNLRRGQFGGSDEQTRAAVLSRMAEEEGALLAGVVDQYNGSYLSTAQLLAEQTKNQTEINRVESVARQEVQGVFDNMNDKIAYAIHSNNYEELKNLYWTAQKHGMDEQAAQILGVIELQAETETFRDALPNLTFADMHNSLKELEQRIVRPDNATSALKVVEGLQGEIDKHQKAFEADPAGYVLEVNGDLFADLRDENGEIRPDAVAEAARININQQRALRRGLVPEERLADWPVRALTVQQAAGIKEMAESREIPPADKLGSLIGLQVGYGALANQVFTEAGLGADLLAAVHLAIDAPQARATAEAMLLAASLSAAEVPPSKRSAADITKDVWDSDYITYLGALRDAMPNVPAFNEQFRKVFDTAERMIKIGGENALQPLDTAYQYRIEPNMVLALPASSQTNISYVQSGLEIIGEDLSQFHDFYHGSAGWDQLDFAALAQSGVWISLNSGQELAMISNGQMVFSLPLQQVLSVGSQVAAHLQAEQDKIRTASEQMEFAGTGASEFNPRTGE